MELPFFYSVCGYILRPRNNEKLLKGG